MAKCPNCGIEVEIGAKFCMECGQPIPQMKECPACHAQCPLTAKFCVECGYNFNAGDARGGSVIGEKNVIAGDVHVDQSVMNSTTNNTHNVTINNTIKNEDETRRTVCCHVCGHKMSVIESYDCNICRKPTCSECYNKATTICRDCADKKYRERVREAYQDGKIDYVDRKSLDDLKKQLFSDNWEDRAEKIEDEIEKEFRTATGAEETLSIVQKESLKEATESLFNRYLPQEAVKSLGPVYKSHPYNEDVLAVYLPALAISDRDAYDRIRSDRASIDSISVELSYIDHLMRESRLENADDQIEKALKKWPDCRQLLLRRVVCYLMVFKTKKKRNLLDAAKKRFLEIVPSHNPIENSWYDYAAAILAPYIKDIDARRHYPTNIYAAIADGTYLGFHPVMVDMLIDKNWGLLNTFASMEKLAFDADQIEALSAAYDNKSDIKAGLLLGVFLLQNLMLQKKKTDESLEDEQFKRALQMLFDAARQGYAAAQFLLGLSLSKIDEVKAVDFLRMAAEQGYVDAQYNMGLRYDSGSGVAKDEAEAAKWYRKAAEQGHAQSQWLLGKSYENGTGVAKDEAEAAKWYRKAAEQGIVKAQVNLSIMYIEGKGVPQDHAEAVKWIKLAAEQGETAAQLGLSMLYLAGTGVPQDYSEAVKWCCLAAEQGHVDAQYRLGEMYKDGRGVAKDDTEAARWIRKAAEQGHVDAQYRLGQMYFEGWGVLQNDSEAAKWLRKAAEQGYGEAQCFLGWMYRVGRGVAQDDTDAVLWLRKAAEQGNGQAQCNLGWMYSEGRFLLQDPVEVVPWVRKAADEGFANAQYKLGQMYDKGQGVTRNQEESVRWFRKAAEQGHSNALFDIAYCYEHGEGVQQDCKEAVKWYRKAAEKGNESASRALERLNAEELKQLQAMFEKGEHYYYGRNGMRQDYIEAEKWYRKAAELGHVDAQFKLGMIYERGV